MGSERVTNVGYITVCWAQRWVSLAYLSCGCRAGVNGPGPAVAEAAEWPKI